MAKQKKQQTTPAPVLPPIPTHTVAGVRALAIAETLDALHTVRGPHFGLQADEVEQLAEALRVPALFIDIVCREGSDASVTAYAAWRRQLATGKAVS